MARQYQLDQDVVINETVTAQYQLTACTLINETAAAAAAGHPAMRRIGMIQHGREAIGVEGVSIF